MFLTDFEYDRLKPYREKILRFKETGKYSGGEMTMFDEIRQKKGQSPTHFECDGCKMSLLLDIYNMVIEYETRGIK